MHSLNLGVFLIVTAEGILALARASPLPLNAALKDTYRSFQAFIRRNKIPCSQKAWTQRSLHLTGEVENYPWLKAKAYNSRVILAWLAVPCQACLIKMLIIISDMEFGWQRLQRSKRP